ncbi:hypothetical protein Tco_1352645 [Tanacetum coccineum]
MNLPDHRSVLTDPEVQVKMEMEIPRSNLQHSFRNSDKFYHDPEECEHAGPKVTTSHEGNTPQQGGLRDLKWMMISKNAQRSHKSKEQSSRITT